MYELCYNYVKPKYAVKAKLSYIDTHSFIEYIKTADIYKDIAEDVETRFDTSDNELDISLPKIKNKKVIRLMKDKLGGKIMTVFAALRQTTYSYLTDDIDENKKDTISLDVISIKIFDIDHVIEKAVHMILMSISLTLRISILI